MEYPAINLHACHKINSGDYNIFSRNIIMIAIWDLVQRESCITLHLIIRLCNFATKITCQEFALTKR